MYTRAMLIDHIRTIPDYPKPGIQFRDITTLLGHPAGFRRAVDEMVQPFAGTGVIIAMVQGGLLARATRAIGETGTFLAGTALLAAGLLGERLVTDVEGFVVQAAVLCFGYSLCQPTVLSLISGRAPPERQGAAMGTAATAGSLGRIAGPLVAGVLFEQVGPSAPQTLAGLLIVVLLALAARSLAGRRRS